MLFEKGESVGNLWNGGLDSLAMHTPFHGCANDNNLAYDSFAMFKSKLDVREYLNKYADLYDLKAHILPSTPVTSVSTSLIKEYPWKITTNNKVYYCKHVVIASGLYNTPFIPKQISDSEEFKGIVVHSWNCKNGNDFKDKKVLIVGSGNSGAEIAVECIISGAQSVDMLAGSPRYYIPKRYLEIYYKLLMKMQKLKALFGINSLTFDDILYELYYHQYGHHYNTKSWCDQQIIEDRFLMLLSKDLSSYGLPLCQPLKFGESAYERFHVIDANRTYTVDEQVHSTSFIELISNGKINVFNGKISKILNNSVIIDCIINPNATKTPIIVKNQNNADTAVDNHNDINIVTKSVERQYDVIIYATVIIDMYIYIVVFILL